MPGERGLALTTMLDFSSVLFYYCIPCSHLFVLLQAGDLIWVTKVALNIGDDGRVISKGFSFRNLYFFNCQLPKPILRLQCRSQTFS